MKFRFTSLLAPLATISPLAAFAADDNIPSTSTSTGTSTSISTSYGNIQIVTPASLSLGLEIDVIYPRSNATYNLTDALPIIFAFQNLSALQSAEQSNGQSSFQWGIMPFGKVGENQEPGGVYEDSWNWQINAAPTLDPYILVNVTNVHEWANGPYYPLGSVYELQFGLTWSPDNTTDCPFAYTDGHIFFNIKLGDPEPDLLGVPECPQLGVYVDLGTNLTTSCLDPAPDNVAGAPCAVKVDKTMASSISSVVQYSATSTSASPTPTSASAQNSGLRSNAQDRFWMAATCVVVSLKLAS